MSTGTRRRRRLRRWGPGCSAILFIVGFILATTGAAFAYWSVPTLYASPNYALASAASLSAPTSPTATATGASITVGWTLPGTQLAGAQYQVTRISGPGSPVVVCTVASTVTSCGDTALMSRTTYGYSTAAIKSSWQSTVITSSATTTKGSQTITFTSTAPTSARLGGFYTPTATASSGLPVTLTIDATARSVCSIFGSTVVFTASGTCTVDADQPGNANFDAAPQAQQSFTVGKASQTTRFTSTAPTTARVGGTYTATATASSGLPVTLTIDATATAVCSISASTVTFTAPGTCQVNANQSGNTFYDPSPQVQQSFTVSSGPTITITSCNTGSGRRNTVIGTTTVNTGTVTVRWHVGAGIGGAVEGPNPTSNTFSGGSAPFGWSATTANNQLSNQGNQYTAEVTQTDGAGAVSNTATCTANAN